MAAIPEREYQAVTLTHRESTGREIRSEADSVDFSSTGPRLLARAPPAPSRGPECRRLQLAPASCERSMMFRNVILDRDLPGEGVSSLETRITGHTSAASDTRVPMPFCGNDPG